MQRTGRLNLMSDSKNILVVCTGNICRSPMAEYLLRARLPATGQWQVASVGLAAADGQPASAPALEVLAEQGIDATAHRSRMVRREWLEQAAYVLVMTRGHSAAILAQWPEFADKVYLIAGFGPEGEVPDIADPIGQSTAVYRQVADQLKEAIDDFILYLADRGEIDSRQQRERT